MGWCMGKPVITASIMKEAIKFLSEVHTSTQSWFLGYPVIQSYSERDDQNLWQGYLDVLDIIHWILTTTTTTNNTERVHMVGYSIPPEQIPLVRFEWKFFQSSFAVAILAWMLLAFSLVNRVHKSSPLESIMFSLCLSIFTFWEKFLKEEIRHNKKLYTLKYMNFLFISQ